MPSPSKAKAARKVSRVMHEFKQGELESSSGDKVRSRQQAIAIGLSEARRSAGAKSVAPSPSGDKTKAPGKSGAGRK
jgi:mevalonate pyrophosphate decarboxylase